MITTSWLNDEKPANSQFPSKGCRRSTLFSLFVSGPGLLWMISSGMNIFPMSWGSAAFLRVTSLVAVRPAFFPILRARRVTWLSWLARSLSSRLLKVKKASVIWFAPDAGSAGLHKQVKIVSGSFVEIHNENWAGKILRFDLNICLANWWWDILRAHNVRRGKLARNLFLSRRPAKNNLFLVCCLQSETRLWSGTDERLLLAADQWSSFLRFTWKTVKYG